MCEPALARQEPITARSLHVSSITNVIIQPYLHSDVRVYLTSRKLHS